MPETTAQRRGRRGEDDARHYLERQGLALVTRNYRCPRGEIDLVMRHGDHLVFVEVRYRKHQRFGSGAESVDARKQGRLVATAQHYLQANRRAAARPSRFDVVSITASGPETRIEWIQNAFEA